MGFFDWGKDKPKVKTRIYSKFIETAIKSNLPDVYPFIHIYACDHRGERNGKIEYIKFTCLVDGDADYGMFPLRRQVIKEDIWMENGYYKFYDSEDDRGNPVVGFTVWFVWPLDVFIDNEKFPKYSNYNYILSSLAEHTTKIEGVKDVAFNSKGYGFYVELEH